MQQTADINGAPHRSRGYAIDIDALLHFAVELTRFQLFVAQTVPLLNQH